MDESECASAGRGALSHACLYRGETPKGGGRCRVMRRAVVARAEVSGLMTDVYDNTILRIKTPSLAIPWEAVCWRLSRTLCLEAAASKTND